MMVVSLIRARSSVRLMIAVDLPRVQFSKQVPLSLE